MTDILKAAPFDSRAYSDTMVTLDVDLARPTALTQAQTDWLGPWKAVQADETGLSLELRRLIPRYLAARERFEETGHPHGDAAYEYSTASEALVHALVALGAYETDEAAFAAVEAMTAPYLAPMFVEAWTSREGYLDDLGPGEIARIAAQVEDLVAEGSRLDDLGMADLVAPHFPGGGE